MSMKISTALFRNLLLSSLLTFSSSGAPCFQAAAAENAHTAQAEVGKKAPDFALSDIDGKSVTLSKLQGKFVVLEWFNDGCPFVKKHYNSGNMQGLQKEYGKKGVVWLSICSSAPGKQGNHANDEFKKILKDWKAEPAYLLVDAEGTVGRLYGAKTTPDMFVIGKDGSLVYAGAIDDQPVPDPESIKKARNYVREALDQAMSGKDVATKVTKSYGCSVKYKS
jgi:peroxiredoxin